jgi:hypothetical protein
MTGKRRSGALAGALALVLTATAPAAAQEGGEDQQQSNPEELAREGAERIMRAIEGILQFIPQYGMPRIQEDGDIVIPRLNPPEEDGQQNDEPSDGGDAPAPQTEI